MPPYHDPGKFKRRMARLERARLELNRNLSERVANRPKPAIAWLCAQIGKEVRRLRTSVGMTQVKLGGIINTSQGAIGRIESGRHNLTVKNLEKIAKALGKKIKIIFE